MLQLKSNEERQRFMTEKSRSERGGRRRFNLKRREACTGWLFVSPALIGFSIFTFGSILYSLY